MVVKIKNKLGVSLMISYVLLVVIAISMAGLLYVWLQSYIPQEQLECPDGVSLIVRDFNCCDTIDGDEIICSLGKFTIEVQNKGFYDIDGFYIKFSQDKQKEPYITPRLADNAKGVYETIPGTILFSGEGLKPGDSKVIPFDYNVLFEGVIGDECLGPNPHASGCADKAVVIKIEPYIQDSDMDERIALCNNAIVVQEINCEI